MNSHTKRSTFAWLRFLVFGPFLILVFLFSIVSSFFLSLYAESTSDVVEGTYGHRTERLIYGVFTTPENSIYGSAVCAFRLQDVMDSFEGAFKVQKKRKLEERLKKHCHHFIALFWQPFCSFIHSLRAFFSSASSSPNIGANFDEC